VLSAAYQFTNQFIVEVTALDDSFWSVKLTRNSHEHDTDVSLAAKKMQNIVVDHQLQHHLDARFGTLRDTLYKFAFSPIESGGLKKKAI